MVGSSSSLRTMPPPRTSTHLTSSFSVTDSNNEVVCPLRNQDGSSCRKRCIGEKRYRSMQEHIRRAHPEHYISKLPATEESFQLMINTPPSERPPPSQAPSSQPPRHPAGQHQQHSPYLLPSLREALTPDPGPQYQGPNQGRYNNSGQSTPKYGEYEGGMMPAVGAAQALASLHNSKLEQDWESEPDWHSDTDAPKSLHNSIELPPLRRMNMNQAITSDPYNPLNRPNARNHFPALLNSPPGRSSTLPPIQHGRVPGSRPRKDSLKKVDAAGVHRRRKSRESQLQAHMRRMSYERKAYSAEPSAGYGGYGKRWEDLIDAATSATEDGADGDRPPIPHSPMSGNRNSMPPFHPNFGGGGPSYQASPLQQALTPPSYGNDAPNIPPIPSVEADSFGQAPPTAVSLSDSSPANAREPGRKGGVEIYCAGCHGVSKLKESYACTECIAGLCQQCVDVLMAEGEKGHGVRSRCPRCGCVGGKFRPLGGLDVR